MQIKKPVERRRGARLHVGIESIVLRCRVADSTKPNPSTPLGTWKEVLCKDINMSGLRFLTAERLAPRTSLEFEISLRSEEETPMTIGGKVVWQKPYAPSTLPPNNRRAGGEGTDRGDEFETGVQLDQLKEADQARFTDFVFSTLHQLFKR